MVPSLGTVCLTLTDVSTAEHEDARRTDETPRVPDPQTSSMTSEPPESREPRVRHFLDRTSQTARFEFDVDDDSQSADDTQDGGKQASVQFKDENPFTKPSKVVIGSLSLDNLGQTIPGSVGGKLGVDHQHYEQWARNPVRKPPQHSVLLRGIQQLRARVHGDRGGPGDSMSDLSSSVDMNPNTLTATDRDKSYMPKLGQSWTFRREKTSSSIHNSDLGSTKPHTGVRKPLKPNPQTIDADACFDEEDSSQVRDRRYPGFTARDLAIPRCGFSKVRDRYPLHVAVHQPKYLGDNVFLINEPVKYPDFLRERSKVDTKPVKVGVHPEHPEIKITIPDVNDPNDPFSVPYRCQRSNTILSTNTPKRPSQVRVPVNVSSAELIDFTQFANASNSFDEEYLKYLERGKTSYSVRRPKHSASTSVFVRGPRMSGKMPKLQPQRMLLKQ